MADVRQFPVPDGLAGMRLDAGLARLLGLSRTTVAGLIDQGDVLVDQIPFMRRCGFDAFAPESAIDPVTLEASLARYDHVYQPAADAAVPVWKLRHG